MIAYPRRADSWHVFSMVEGASEIAYISPIGVTVCTFRPLWMVMGRTATLETLGPTAIVVVRTDFADKPTPTTEIR